MDHKDNDNPHNHNHCDRAPKSSDHQNTCPQNQDHHNRCGNDNSHATGSASQWLTKAKRLARGAMTADASPEKAQPPKTPARSQAAQQFLAQAQTAKAHTGPLTHHARLIFAMDATASRQPTWDRAMQLQAEMFKATAALGGLNVQLCYFRGYSEFTASPWLQDARNLETKMRLVDCLGGYTQLEKVIRHALAQQQQQPARALVFVGDAVEEDVDLLCHLAGKLGQTSLPMYIFQEGDDPFASQAFAQMARCSKGVHLQLTQGSAKALASLLGAVAAWATGGATALNTYVSDQQTAGNGSLLLTQLSHTLLEDLDSKA